MQTLTWPGFVYSSYESQSWAEDQERTVNLLWERMESQGANSRFALYRTPGVVSVGTGLGSPGRAHFAEAGREFAVQGTSFVEIDESGTVTPRGSVATSAVPATICSNGDGGNQLLITSGDNGYFYDLTSNVLTQIANLTGKARQGGFIKGYGAVLDANTSTLYISALLDFATWNTGTDFAQRSDASDPWRAMSILNGIFIVLLGEFTSELWYNSGNASFPFAPYPSASIPYGIAAGFSVAVGEGSLVWLGQSRVGQRMVLKTTGSRPDVVSDFPRQFIFNTYGTVSDAQAEFINWQGHTLYLITFPTENVTWCYDLTTNKWCEWRTWISEQNDYAALRQRWHVMAFGQHRMLDSQTGSIYRLDGTVSTDVDDRPIRWLRRGPVLTQNNQRIFVSAFELCMERGVGTATGQGVQPVVMMRWSKDGGKNWGTERMGRVGKVGEYTKRLRWERLGMGRWMTAEVSGTDPVPGRMIDAFVELAQPIKGGQGRGRAA